MAVRNALIVAYHYPPIRSAGVERTVKFEQYLPEFGYRTSILTTAAFGGSFDGRLLRAWEPLALYRWLFNREARRRPETSTQVRTSVAAHHRRARGLVGRWLLLPDGQITWVPAALASGLSLVRRESIDVIYSSSPPASAHLVALMLANLTGLPWVADFRDSWIYDPLDPELSQSPNRLDLESWLESAVVNSADATIAATAISAHILRQRHPAAADRIGVITNGFDPDDLEGAAAGPVPESLLFDTETPIEPLAQQATAGGSDGSVLPMRVVHTGSFSHSHPQRSPEGLFGALASLLAEDEAWTQRLRVVLVGRLSSRELTQAEELIQCGIVEIAGDIDVRGARRFQSSADLLLVVDHPRSWPASNVPGKFYDYLGVGCPVLALCSAGALADLMDELGAGVRVAPDDATAIARVLRDLCERYEKGNLGDGGRTNLRRFHRRALSGELAACFDRTLKRRSAAGI